ncbi:MAG TPA: hypothetical protein VEV16_12595, partial [Daejeonella sp.]|nr:hypothetical protein [Daejeonella sp.]
MLEKLIGLVKENAGDAIVSNSAIPNEHNEDAIQAASGSIHEVLAEKTSSGKLGEMAQLFQGGDLANNPVVAKIKEVFAGKLSNMGVKQEEAQNTASNLIPNVMGKLVNKTNDPNNSEFSLQGLLQHFGGDKLDLSSAMDAFKNAGGGLMDKVGSFFKK